MITKKIFKYSLIAVLFLFAKPLLTFGGILTAPGPDSAVTEAIKEKLVNVLLKEDLKIMKQDEREFILEAADINGDGLDEYFVGFFTSFYFCGSGGCSVYLLNNNLDLVTSFSVAGESIYILNDRSGGWNDLAIFSGGKYRLVQYGGSSYPENPSLCPAYSGKPENNGKVIFEFEKEKKPVRF